MAINKKICLIGAPGVGKTSLVRRFVHSLFDERYLTTVGVCIEKKVVATAGGSVTLVIWDLAGDDELERLQASYLRGTSAYLLVADGTQAGGIEVVIELQARVAAAVGSSVPFVLAINKEDLTESWKMTSAQTDRLTARGWTTMNTSAKDGTKVEDLFRRIAELAVAKE